MGAALCAVRAEEKGDDMTASVLVAIDLTHPEEAAALLGKGRKLLDAGGKFAAVTVIPDFGMSIVGAFFREGSEKEAMELAATKLHEVTESVLGAGYPVQHVIRHGAAYEEILEAAQLVNADLIVIGAHKPDFGDYLLGPNAARVVRHAKASVLVERF